MGAVCARNLFGETIGSMLSLVLSLLLLSTVSAMTLAGPRVIQTLGEDIRGLGRLGARTRRGAPAAAIFSQLTLVILFITTDSFKAILTIAGFTVTLMSWLVVAGLILLRWAAPGLYRPFRVPLYPLTPLAFLVMSGFSLVAVSVQRPLMVTGVLVILVVIGVLIHAGGAAAAADVSASPAMPSAQAPETVSEAPPSSP